MAMLVMEAWAIKWSKVLEDAGGAEDGGFNPLHRVSRHSKRRTLSKHVECIIVYPGGLE